MSDPAACSVLLCPSSEQSRSLRSVCFFDFPHPNDPRYPVWIERTLRPKEWTPSPSSKICSRHFRPSDILALPLADGSGRTEKRLKYDALPCVFEGIPDSMRPQTHVVPRADSPEIVPSTNCSKKRSADCLDESISDEAEKEFSDSLNASTEVPDASKNAQSNVSLTILTIQSNNSTSANVAGPVISAATVSGAKKAKLVVSPAVSAPIPIPIRPACSLDTKIIDGRLTVLEHCAKHIPVDYPARTDAGEARKCCVPGCSFGRDDNPQRRVQFHAFPTDERFRTEWIKRVACSSFWQPAPYSVVCSVHFLETDYGFIGNLLCLKPTAIPSQLGCRNGLMRKLNGPCPFSRVCAICGCWRAIKQTTYYKSASQLAFVPFPEQANERLKWLAFCREVPCAGEFYACERHFALADILARFEQDKEMKFELQRRDGILPHPSQLLVPIPLQSRAPSLIAPRPSPLRAPSLIAPRPSPLTAPSLIAPQPSPSNNTNNSQNKSFANFLNGAVLQSRTVTATPSALLIHSAASSASPGGFSFLVVPNQTAAPAVTAPLAPPVTKRLTLDPSRNVQPQVAVAAQSHPHPVRFEKTTCGQCGLRFNTYLSYSIHEYEHGGRELAEYIRSRTACSDCAEKFDSFDALVEHVKIHGRQTEECPVCKGRFRALNDHIRRDHPDCQYRSRKSPDRVRKDNLHRCGECGKVFKTAYAFDIHAKAHRARALWATLTCSDCGLRFKTDVLCRLHKIHHGNEESTELIRDTRECPDCHQIFESQEGLVEHVREHGKATEKCALSEERYISLANLIIRDHQAQNPLKAAVLACCVPGCQNVWEPETQITRASKVLFFRFIGAAHPRFETWMRRLRYNSSWVPHFHERVCSDHFYESDIRFKNGKASLLLTAVPSQLSCMSALCGFTAADMATGAVGCAVCGLRPPADRQPKASEKLTFFRAPPSALDALRKKWIDFCNQQRNDIDWASIGADTPWYLCENHFEMRDRKATENIGSLASDTEAVPSLSYFLDLNYADSTPTTSDGDLYGNSLMRIGTFCCVPGCETMLEKGVTWSKTFVMFLPPDDERYNEWLRMVRYNASWIPGSRAKICRQHFPASAFELRYRKKGSPKSACLLNTAFPTQLSCMESLCTFTPADMIAGKQGCAVCGLRPFTPNRRLKLSEKLEFFRAPSGEIREKWVEFCTSQRMDIDWSLIPEETPWYLCENHFDAQNKAKCAEQTAIPSLSFSMYVNSGALEAFAGPDDEGIKSAKKKRRKRLRPPACCVPGCRMFAWNEPLSAPVSFHYVGQGIGSRDDWADHIRCAVSWRPKSRDTVCSRHFCLGDFRETSSDQPLQFRKLRANVVPSKLDCTAAYRAPKDTDALLGREGVQTCCVCGCWRPLDKTDLILSERLSFFPFPDDEILRDSWVTSCRQWNPNLTVSKESVICENHFSLDDLTWLLEDGKEARLVPKNSAMPTCERLPVPVRLNTNGAFASKKSTSTSSRKSTSAAANADRITGYKCCVPGCGNRAQVEGKLEKITFHVFPGLCASSRFCEWMNRIRCSISWTPHPLNRVCSKHFSPKDFMEETAKGRQPRTNLLKKDVVPSILQCAEKFRSPMNSGESAELNEVRTCCVCGWWRAAGEKSIQSEILTFFSFPAEDGHREQWVNICREWNPDFVFSEGLLVCENHFQLDELTWAHVSKVNGELKLRSGAVPSERYLRPLSFADDTRARDDTAEMVAGVPFDDLTGLSSLNPDADSVDGDDSEAGNDTCVYEERDCMSVDENAWNYDATADEESLMETDDPNVPLMDITISKCAPLRTTRVAENGLPEDESYTNVGTLFDMPSALPFSTDAQIGITPPPSPPRCAPDDALVYCDCCHKFLPTPCWLHAASICDEPVVPLAVGSLPKMLYLDVCDDSQTGKTVFTKEVIARHTVFGPLIAPLTPGNSEKALYFSVTEEQRRYYELESEYACNWMKHVRFADSLQNSNLLVFSRGSEVVFVTIKTIAPHEELKVWYSKQYLDMVETHGNAAAEDVKLEIDDEVEGTSLPFDDYGELAETAPGDHEVTGSCPFEAVCVAHLPMERVSSLPMESVSSLPLTVDDDYLQSDQRSCVRSKTNRTNKSRGFFTSNICLECNVRFRREDMLRLHQFSHTGYDGQPERECPECSKHYDDFPALLKHVDEHGTPLVQCPVCSETCSLSAIFMHLHRYHPGIERRKLYLRSSICNKCGMRFGSNFLCRLHQLGHQDQECINSIKITRKCPECGEMFENLDKLAAHVDVHGKLTKKCPVCNGYYPGMKRHIARSHPQFSAERTCPECGKQFAHESSFVPHMRGHRIRASLDSWTCRECRLQFPKDSLFVLHKSSHDTAAYNATAGAQRCSECAEEFDGMDALLEHVLTHAVPAENCPECGHWIGRNRLRKHMKNQHPARALRTHMKRHHSARAHRSVLQQDESNDSAFVDKAHDELHKRTPVEALACTDCGLRFLTEDLLHIHEFKHTENETSIGTGQCPECKKSFAVADDLVEHVQAHASNTRKCPLCGRWRVNMSQHLKQKHPENKNETYQCPQCSERFRLRRRLEQHMLQRHGQQVRFRKTTCAQCGLRFSTDLLCRIHEYGHGGKELADDLRNQTTCVECVEAFDSFDALVKHAEIHGRQTEECPVCKERFQALKEHIRRDHPGCQYRSKKTCGDGPYRCEECGKEFQSYIAFTRHANGHRAKATRVARTCSECGLRFKTDIECRLHRIHHGINEESTKPISDTRECPECHQNYENLDELVAHLSEHGRATEKCPVCGEWYAALTVHLRRDHPDYRRKYLRLSELDDGNDHPDEGYSHQTFTCPKCSIEFTSKSGLTAHISVCGSVALVLQHKDSEETPKKFHPRTTPEALVCTNCGLRFLTEELLHLHKHIHTKDEISFSTRECPECRKLFAVADELVEHVAEHATVARKCLVCGQWRVNMSQHFRSQHPGYEKERMLPQAHGRQLRFKKTTCVQCGLRFSTDLLCLIHEYEHGRKNLAEDIRRTTTCDECAEEFEDFDKLVKHVKLHGRQTKECPVCKGRFHALNYHIRAFHPDCQYRWKNTRRDGLYRCEECGKEFESFTVYAPHVTSHRAKAALVARTCSECGLRFKTDILSRLHRMQHGNEESAELICDTRECPECHQKFEHLEELVAHISEHGRATQQCPVCGDWYASLAEHIQRYHPDYHRRRLNLTCSECGLRFTNDLLCRLHEVSHGKLEIAEDIRNTRECPQGDGIFQELDQLVEHVAGHGKPTEKCPVCGQSYAWLKEHIRRDHKEHYAEFVAQGKLNCDTPKTKECTGYRCEKCGKQLPTHTNLDSHMGRHRANELMYDSVTCNECGLRFGSALLCQLHKLQHDSDGCSDEELKNTKSCPECEEEFQEVGLLGAHVAVHGKATRKCPDCSRWFSDLRHHMRREHPESFKEFVAQLQRTGAKVPAKAVSDVSKRKETPQKGYCCTECSRRFENFGSFKRHMQSHGEEDPSDIVTCDMCGLRFMNEHMCELHKVSHGLFSKNLQNTEKCPECGGNFEHLQAMAEHVGTHGVQAEQCSVCNKWFASLRHHARQCRNHDDHRDRFESSDDAATNTSASPKTGDWKKSFECQECGKEFRLRAGLQSHMKTDHAALKCVVCDKVFGSDTDLQQHMLSHSNKNQLKCGICKKTFQSSRIFAAHVREHENGKLPEPVVEEAVPKECVVCRKQFADFLLLNQHVKKHNVNGGFECAMCNETFPFYHLLSRHVMEKQHFRPKIGIPCSVCDEELPDENALQLHLFTHHDAELTVKCYLCAERFTCNDDLDVHTAAAHTTLDGDDSEMEMDEEVGRECYQELMAGLSDDSNE